MRGTPRIKACNLIDEAGIEASLWVGAEKQNAFRLGYMRALEVHGIYKRPKPHPKCLCGDFVAYYGPVGGYSVKCEQCNAENAKRQRKARAT